MAAMRLAPAFPFPAPPDEVAGLLPPRPLCPPLCPLLCPPLLSPLEEDDKGGGLKIEESAPKATGERGRDPVLAPLLDPVSRSIDKELVVGPGPGLGLGGCVKSRAGPSPCPCDAWGLYEL